MTDTFTTVEKDRPEEFDITHYRTTTWTNGSTTYTPKRIKTLDEVAHGPTRITTLEKWYDDNNQVHSDTGPAMIIHEYQINQQGDPEHTGNKFEHYYYHGWTPEEAAEMAYFANKITEEEYHKIAHPEKSANTTYPEVVAILDKGL